MRTWLQTCLLPAILAAGAMSLGILLAQEKRRGPEVVATFGGHTDVVYAVAMSPDGKYVATGSFDNTVKLWEATPAREIKTFGGKEGHQKMVLSVAFNDDGTLIASGGADNFLKVWDAKLAASKPVRSFSHPGHVDAVAFQPGGKLLVSGCHDGKVRVFDLVKGALVKEISAHTAAKANMIYTVAFSPDGKHLVTGSYDHSLKLWDIASGKLVREFKAFTANDFEKGHREGVFCATFSPDGKILASGSGGLERVIKFWNVADGSLLRDLINPQMPATPPVSHPGWVYGLRFTADGKHLMSVGDAPLNKGFLAVWNTTDGKMLFGDTLPLGNFFGLAISPGDQHLAVGAGSRGRPNPTLNNGYLLKMPTLEE
jgi:WD40 repeat protein